MTPPRADAPLIDVLIPSCERSCALAVTLTALSAQHVRNFRITISDQSEGEGVGASAEVRAVLRYLQARGLEVQLISHLPRRGMAEQRAFLLSRVSAPYCLFLDDDVILEPDLLGRLLQSMREQECGFVGSALHGLSFLDDERPHQQAIEFWNSRVHPETVTPGQAAWSRHHLHSAANLFHVQRRMQAEEGGVQRQVASQAGSDTPYQAGDQADEQAEAQANQQPEAQANERAKAHSNERAAAQANAQAAHQSEERAAHQPRRQATRHYRVAWIGGCVLFDTGKLREVGGFDFWPELPASHCGEDVLAQLRVMARFGGCGIFPSGAYHMELPTTIVTREVDAPKVLAG